MTATHTVQVPLAPELSPDALQGHELHGLKTGSLVSIGKLCDDDCMSLFTKYNVNIIKNGKVIITGPRNKENNLWTIPLAPKASPLPTPPLTSTPSTHQASSALRMASTKQDLAKFLHAVLCSPHPSTVIRAIKKGHFTSFPGLTTELLHKHLPKAFATAMGHMRGHQQNVNSTKQPWPAIPLPTSLDIAPRQEPTNPKSNAMFVQLFDTKCFERSYSDQTGKFPVKSSRGNCYIFIMYAYDSNSILSVALPDRRGSSIKHAWLNIYERLRDNGYAPKLHLLDNECATDIKQAFVRHQVDFQRVPAHQHRRNAAERAIQTWKAHFISCLATTDPTFPLNAWDYLLPQCDITLNLLRSSRRQPRLSAYACLFGNFDFNRTPLSVPGTKVAAHDPPSQRYTFAPHGTVGYYVGPALEHYRCYTIFFPSTQRTRECISLQWFPQSIPFPKVSQLEYLRQTADDLLLLLGKPGLRPLFPSLEFGSPTRNAYLEIARLLKRATTPPSPPADITHPDSPPPVNILETSPVPTPPMPPLPSPPPTPLHLQRPLSPPPVSVTTARVSTPRLSFTPEPLPPHQARSPVPAAPARVLLPSFPPPPRPSTPASVPRVANLPPPVTRVGTPTVVPPPRVTTPSPHAPPASPTPPPRRYPTRTRTVPSRYGFAATLLQHQEASDPYQTHIAALTHDIATSAAKTKLPSIHKLLKGPDAHVWMKSNANEFGRLLPRGVGKSRPANERIEGTSTLFPIRKHLIPANRTATYGNFVCAIRPNKTETHRVRLTLGGNLLDFPGDPSSPAVSTTIAKLHINSTISDAHRGARYMTMDIKNFYLGSPLKYFQYVRIPTALLPPEILSEYPEIYIESDGYTYFEARKGIYGLKEAGLIAFENLVRNLKPFGYAPVKFTPGIWTHTSRPTTFTLCVDDFGIKYFSKGDALHLVNAVQQNYEITTDWSGSLYCGFNLAWNYNDKYVDVSMTGYVQRALERFHHKKSHNRTQHAPHPWQEPAYGRTGPQRPTPTPQSPLLDAAGTRRIQAITGTFNFYSEVDPCIKPALNEIGTVQAAPTEDTNRKVQMLLDYLHDHPDATLRYHASDMILQVEADSAYLVLPKARSRAAAWFILGNDPSTRPVPMTNAPLHILCNTIKNVMASAAEAEAGGLFLAVQKACPLRIALAELGHPQPPQGTPLYNDNKTTTGILNATMRQKLSKAFDMRVYWVRDRVLQKQYQLIWRKGTTNMADYFTKHHPPWYHKQMRYKYLHRALSLLPHNSVRGCVTPPPEPSNGPHYSRIRHSGSKLPPCTDPHRYLPPSPMLRPLQRTPLTRSA